MRRPRRLLVLAAALWLAGAAQADDGEEVFPRLSGRVVDEAEVLSPDAESRLLALLTGHEAATGNQVVVVTLSSLRGYDIAAFGARLAAAWGLGQAGREQGVLIIVAPRERALRIVVAPALASVLSDAGTRLIIEREMLPLIAAGRLEDSVLQGAQAVLSSLAGGYIPPPEASAGMTDETLAGIAVISIAGIYLLLVALLLYRGYRWRPEEGLPVTTGAALPAEFPVFSGGGAAGRW